MTVFVIPAAPAEAQMAVRQKKKMDIPEAAILLSRNMEGLLRKAIMIPGTPADTQEAAIREEALEAAPVPEED